MGIVSKVLSLFKLKWIIVPVDLGVYDALFKAASFHSVSTADYVACLILSYYAEYIADDPEVAAKANFSLENK